MRDHPIFGGRWQPPHLGHHWVFNKLISEYDKLTVAIVNFDPSNPPDPNFDKFYRTANVLGYWDRYYLLMNMFIAEGYWSKVRIVPCWHPRKKMKGENYFFPPKNRRFWVCPLTADEEEKKIDDFRTIGETVEIIMNVPENILKFSGTNVRQLLISNDNKWQSLIHPKVHKCLLDIDYKRKIVQSYDNLYFNKPNILKKQLNTALIVGYFCPILADLLNLIDELTEEFDTVTICPICVIKNDSHINWPEFYQTNDQCELNFWERQELIRIIESERPNLFGRIIIYPMLIKNNDLVVNYQYLPSNRKWFVLNNHLNNIANYLISDGEIVTLLNIEKKLEEILNTIDSYLISKQIEFLNSIKANIRRISQMEQTKKKSGGMNFFGNVSVYGDVINVEGNQYNLSTNDKNEVLRTLVALIKSNMPNDQIINALDMLNKNENIMLTKDEVKDVVVHELKDEVHKPEKRKKLKLLLDDISKVVVTGNNLVGGIAIGLQLLGIM